MANVEHIDGHRSGGLRDFIAWGFQSPDASRRMARSGMLILSFVSFLALVAFLLMSFL
jgi:hypothetical protein